MTRSHRRVSLWFICYIGSFVLPLRRCFPPSCASRPYVFSIPPSTTINPRYALSGLTGRGFGCGRHPTRLGHPEEQAPASEHPRTQRPPPQRVHRRRRRRRRPRRRHAGHLAPLGRAARWGLAGALGHHRRRHLAVPRRGRDVAHPRRGAERGPPRHGRGRDPGGGDGHQLRRARPEGVQGRRRRRAGPPVGRRRARARSRHEGRQEQG